MEELGYPPFEPNAAHLFFQFVLRRYERSPILATGNRAVSDWGTVFGDCVVATAILNRLLHHSQVITIRGENYRLARKTSARSRAKAANRQRSAKGSRSCPAKPRKSRLAAAGS